MALNLKKDAVLAREHIDLLNEIGLNARAPFCQMIDGQAKGREADINWWASELASRNTMTSDLFDDCCLALLAARLLESEDELDKIIVESAALKKVLDGFIRQKKSHAKVICAQSARSRRLGRLRASLLGMLKSAATLFWRYRESRWNPTRLAPRDLDNRTLVDVFVFEHSFKQGRYQDRYYADFGGCLNPAVKQSMVYLATPQINLKATRGVIAQLRAAEQPMLLAEDMLSPSDYLFALGYPLRALGRRPRKAVLMGLEVTALLNDVWLGSLGSFSSINGLLRYRFARRLGRLGVRPRMVLDWFENQILDKAGNAGFRKFLPGTELVGYQANIIHPFYLCSYPTEKEYASKVTPARVGVCGKQPALERKEFCPSLETFAAPAFRYAGLWKPRVRQPASEFFTVLVPLSITAAESIQVMEVVLGAARVGVPEKTRFWVKPHPGAGDFNKLLSRAGLTLGPAFQVVGGDFLEVAEQSNLMIGNASGTCLEMVARGVPVIIVGSRNRITQNPIPESVDPAIWGVCFEPEEVAAAIRQRAAEAVELGGRYQEIARKVREDYFEKVTPQGVDQLLEV